MAEARLPVAPLTLVLKDLNNQRQTYDSLTLIKRPDGVLPRAVLRFLVLNF